MKNKKIESLQMLRAIAACSVVYYHIKAIPNFGSFGVDLFFVLSGYLMAQISESNQRPMLYFVDRIIRIYPLYFLASLMVLIVALVLPEGLGTTTFNIPNFLKSILFIPYFREGGSLEPILIVGWTLNYEMFFYVLVSLSLCLHRYRVLFLIFSIVFAYLFGRFSDGLIIKVFLGNEIIFEFLVGYLLYLFINKFGSIKNYKINLMMIIVGYMLMVLVQLGDFQFNRFIKFGIASAFILFAFVGLDDFLKLINLRIVKLFSYVGDASYSLYIIHLFVVFFCTRIIDAKFNIFHSKSLSGIILIILLNIFIACLVHKYIDSRIHKYLKGRIHF